MDSNFQFPPGFRFHPSDEELIIHYLRNKVASHPLPASVVAEIDLYKHNPWELPNKALFGEDEWYFFSPRDRKYPNGVRPNRAAGSGYWKATGTDRPILTCSGSKNIGVKKALVFYSGRPPKGIKTDWIMNEYRLLDSTIKPLRSKVSSMRLDDWVLCRIRKKGSRSTNANEVQGGNNKEIAWHLPRIEEACHAHTSYNTDMITDCLNKDCRLLASILAGQALPPIQTITSVSNQESKKDNSFTSVYDDGSDKMDNSPITASSFNYYSPFRRKSNEEERCDNILQPNRSSSDNRNENLHARETIPWGDKNYYSKNQSQVSFYNPNMFDLINGSCELSQPWSVNFLGEGLWINRSSIL